MVWRAWFARLDKRKSAYKTGRYAEILHTRWAKTVITTYHLPTYDLGKAHCDDTGEAFLEQR